MNQPPEKIQRFIKLIKMFIREVELNRSLAIIQNIDDSYYMQKCEELRMLLEALTEQDEKLRILHSRINTHYQEVYYQWKTDYRWLNNHLRNKKNGK